jgi:radical SAM protein with 4Fe4S-binding SPASM domain|tara:strand:+ start:4661 stop:5668 length:1008 start_codon:yes stop_codon:yes gene_type:complete
MKNHLNIIQPEKLIDKPVSEMKGSEIQDKNMELYKNKSVTSLRPAVIWIEPTDLCNLKCKMCPIGVGDGLDRPKGMMKMDLYKKIIDEVSEWKPVIKLFHTGESLIHPGLEEMIRYAKERGCFVMLNTNATIMNERKSQMILDSGLDYLSFSFDGATKEVYENIRIGGNFETTMENIINFLKMRKEQAKRKPFVNVEMIKMKDTEEEVEKFKNTFKEHSVDNIGIKKLMNWGDQVPVEGEMEKVFTDLSCLHPWSFANILYDGSVVPCCRDSHAKHVLGDVNEDKLMDIWNKNYKMLKFRETLAEENGHKKIDICSNCTEVFVDRISDEDARMLG